MTLNSLKERKGYSPSRHVAVAGAILVAALSLTGCGATASASGPASSASAVTTYGQAIGSGEKVQSELGSYERITLDKSAPVYKYNNGESTPAAMNDAGFTAQDGADAQRFAIDYIVREFIDSSALNGGDKAYQDWYKTTAPKYFTSVVLQDQSLRDGTGTPLIGNNNGTGVPNLINDGAPREKNVDLKVSGFRPYTDASGKTLGVKFSIGYEVDYRVNDKNAAELAAKYGNMSVADFLASNHAKPALKDGQGENVFGASGNVNLIVNKVSQGEWKIVGLQSDAKFDTSDFAQK